MKIALVVPPLLKTPPTGYGGLEQVVYDLGCALVAGGDDVTLFAPPGSHIDGGKLFETIVAPERTDVNWVQLEGDAYNKYSRELLNYDIVHDHSWFGFPYLIKMSNPGLPGLKVCHTHHGHLDWNPSCIPPQIGKVNLIGISPFMKREYAAQGWKSEYVYNGIDINKYAYSKTKGDRLVFVGRISKLKHPDIAIRAAIATKTPIDIIGGSFVDDKEYLESIKTMCDTSNGIATLHLDLPMDKKIEFVRSAKANLVPSAFGEPFGLCLHPYTKIVTEYGIKSILDVNESDSVMTHAGRFRKVLKTMRREYDGDLVTIKSYGSVPSVTTPEHPYLVMKRIGAKGFFDKPVWTMARDINKGDVMLSPVITDIIDVEDISVNIDNYDVEDGYIIPSSTNQYGVSHRILNANPIPEKISITPDVMRLFGYYLAEGSCKNSVEFDFHRDETDYINDVCQILSNTFNVTPTVEFRKSAKVGRITVSSRILCRFFRSLFGSGAHAKHIPTWMIYLPHQKQIELVKGMWRGDGYRDKYSFRYHTVSPSLSWGYCEILMRNGISVSVTKTLTNGFGRKHLGKSRDIYCNTISGRCADRFSELAGEEKCKPTQRKSMFKRRTSGDTVYSMVADVSKIHYVGTVYNLSVEEDETYCTESHLVHNCAVEALACGTPVVVFDDGALKDIVGENGDIGYVCKTEEEMIKIVGDIDKIKIQPSRCRSRAEYFSRENMAKRYKSLYEKIIKGEEW